MPPTRRAREAEYDQNLTDAQIYDASPVALWATDLQHRIVSVNNPSIDLLRAVTGRLDLDRESILGRKVPDIVPPDIAQPFVRSDAQVSDSRSRVVTTQRVRTVAGIEQWYELTKQPWISPLGDMIGVIGVARQIPRPAPGGTASSNGRNGASTHAADGQHLRHAMTMVVTLIQAMQRSPDSDRATLEALGHRVGVVSLIEQLLRSAPRSLEFGELLRRVGDLSCRGAEGRLITEGPEVRLAPEATVATAMALHELLHNSARHGALSARGGCTTIHWTRRPALGLRIDWVEDCDDPPHPEPLQHGFGLTLAHGLIVHDLAGRCDLDLHPQGLHIHLVLGPQALTDA